MDGTCKFYCSCKYILTIGNLNMFVKIMVLFLSPDTINKAEAITQI